MSATRHPRRLAHLMALIGLDEPQATRHLERQRQQQRMANRRTYRKALKGTPAT